MVFACEGVGARDQLQFEFYRNGERYYADLWDGALGHSRVFASPGVNVGYYWMFESAVIDLGELGPSTAPESWEVWVSAWREVEDAANTLVEYRTTGLVRLSLDGVHLSVSGEHPWTSVLAAGSGGGIYIPLLGMASSQCGNGKCQ